jgi:hypothetical protein
MTDLGRLTPVPARHVWKDEAGEFTPWLAQPINLELLGQTIGMELELEATERSVGPFRADILCKDVATDEWVLIENQLERTDHRHLGQLLTYAAGLKAVKIVWIANPFTEEHRAALDWLNNITDADFNFFGLEVEAWRIGDSAVAPKFNLVAKPNEWSKSVADEKARVELTETKQLQYEFWQYVRDALAEARTAPSLQTPRPQYWYNVAIGRTGFHISMIADTMGDRVGVRLMMRARYGGSRALELLLQDRDEIESEFDHALEWDANPEASDKSIASHHPAVLADKQSWSEVARWLVEEVGRFLSVLGPRVKALDLDRSDDREGA